MHLSPSPHKANLQVSNELSNTAAVLPNPFKSTTKGVLEMSNLENLFFKDVSRALDSLMTHDLMHIPLDIAPKTMLAQGWPSTRNMHVLHDP